MCFELHRVRRLAFDGRGNYVVQRQEDLSAATQALGGYEQGLYAERWVEFTKVNPHLAKSVSWSIVSQRLSALYA